MKLKRTVPELITNAFLILLAVLFVAGVTPDRTGAFAPFLVLPIFFLSLWRLGKSLYSENRQAATFVLFAAALYVMCALREGREAVTGIFLHSGEGLVILSCVVMPLGFCMVLQWLKKVESRIELCIMAVAMVLAGQFCDAKGGFYILLMLLLGIMVKIVRKGYAYVITSGCFKKRI